MKTMDTQRRDIASGASVDTASKKLRQALLPFQVISPVGVSSAAKKRKIIDETDAKVSKNSRLEKQAQEIDLTEAKENVNLEVQKSETSSNSIVMPPVKEKSVEPVDDEEDEVLCLNLGSGEECAESVENACNKSLNEVDPSIETIKECKSKENAVDVAVDTEGTTPKKDEGCSSDKSDGNKSIEMESDSDLEKTEENADSSINILDVSIGDSDVKGSLSGSEETSEMNTSAASQASSTPKQQVSLQKKKLLSLKKKEQREKVRQELERKKEEQRKEKEERLLQKKKEKEEEMKRRLSQKLEEKQKKEEERNQKKKQKEEEKLKKEEEKQKKEEEKQKEKQKREEEKQKERQKREEEKQKERQKKEEEKKKLEEEEERKKKAAAAFASFFVPKKSSSAKIQEEQVTVEAFMPFRVKGDMRLAPVVRRILSKEDKKDIEMKIEHQSGEKLYLTELKEKSRTPRTHPETWPLSELKEDVVILEDEEDVPTSEDKLVLDPHHDERFHAKLLQFCENRRPPYWGTWRKKSSKVGPRRPFYRDEKYFDYEVDSDDEWEEEEPGESLHGSDDEKESEDEYEVDNEFFVPHGYLSDEEAAAEEADDEVVSPETQKAKLKLLGIEFEEEMKQKTKQIKPQLIGCYWINETMDEHLSHQYEKIFSQYKAVTSNVIPTSFTVVPNTPLASALGGNQVDVTSTSSTGRKKKIFPEEAMPDLIKLLHGNRNGWNFLALEFYAHLSKGNEESEEERKPGESPVASNSRVSKGSIAKKIREIATWKLCTDEGPNFGKNFCFVSDSVRAQYNLTDLPQTNQWKYNLKPKMRGKVKAETSTVDGSPTSKIVEVGDEPSPTQPKKPHLITKFTKVISKEERLKQLNQIMQSSVGVTPFKANESNPVTKPSPPVSEKNPSNARSNLKCSSKSEKTTPIVSGEPKVKKRIPLLVSVPRGQEIPKNYSLPSFLKQKPGAEKQQSNSEDNDKKSDITKVAAKENPVVIEID